MAGHENTLKKMLEDYIESLDDEKENQELLMELENISKNCDDAKKYYEEARLNQYLFYKRLVYMKESNILDSLISEFRRKNAKTTNYSNIWRYFNELIKSKGVSWKKVLNSIGMDTRFADRLRKEKMNIYRISAEKLVAITNLLEGDPNIVLQLAYKWLAENKKTRPNNLAVSYREVRDELEEVEFDLAQNEQKKDEIRDYIAKLEKAFN